MVLGTLTSYAQSQTSMPDSATLLFINQAAQAGAQEISNSQLAISRTKNEAVKVFAETMVTDHNNANAKLMQIVKSRGWQIPPPSGAYLKPDTMLTTERGKDFDKDYVRMMLSDHKQAVSTFELASLNLPKGAVKNFALTTLPILRQHLARIQDIASGMGIK